MNFFKILRPIRLQILCFAKSCRIIKSENSKTSTLTHTGHDYDADDKRNVLFVDGPKYVNPRHAIDFITKDPVVLCDNPKVYSHSGGALGHPKVFINLKTRRSRHMQGSLKTPIKGLLASLHLFLTKRLFLQ
ncbi:hypothetical protein A3Q56_01121 [Intoshia linei]|uniref:Uncharacterized protein n=1 Tax=Intoshia linei TaxID=1819745 RepID=A0A177BA16_9BILA|nr:hypothetical protein A3Q56_01121 [Intoshia linei]